MTLVDFFERYGIMISFWLFFTDFSFSYFNWLYSSQIVEIITIISFTSYNVFFLIAPFYLSRLVRFSYPVIPRIYKWLERTIPTVDEWKIKTNDFFKVGDGIGTIFFFFLTILLNFLSVNVYSVFFIGFSFYLYYFFLFFLVFVKKENRKFGFIILGIYIFFYSMSLIDSLPFIASLPYYSIELLLTFQKTGSIWYMSIVLGFYLLTYLLMYRFYRRYIREKKLCLEEK